MLTTSSSKKEDTAEETWIRNLRPSKLMEIVESEFGRLKGSEQNSIVEYFKGVYIHPMRLLIHIECY